MVYRTSDGQAVWASQHRHAMFSRLPLKLSMQHDRNLVTYAGVQNSKFCMMEAGWASNTCGRGVPGGGVILDDDGHLRIHDGDGTLLWTSLVTRDGAGRHPASRFLRAGVHRERHLQC